MSDIGCDLVVGDKKKEEKERRHRRWARTLKKLGGCLGFDFLSSGNLLKRINAFTLYWFP